MFGMVTSVNSRMIRALGEVKDASALVFVGHRDWQTLNRWQKINVSRILATSSPLQCAQRVVRFAKPHGDRRQRRVGEQLTLMLIQLRKLQ